MHDGCTGPSTDGKAVTDKVRMMGFSRMPMPAPLKLTCVNCENSFAMTNFEGSCPECDMVYAVTPCHASDPGSVKAAGIGY